MFNLRLIACQKDCRQSFRFSELIQSLDAHDDSALTLDSEFQGGDTAESSTAVQSDHTIAEERVVPSVSPIKPRSSTNVSSRSGFFKRLFSISSPQSVGDLRGIHNESLASGSIRHQRSGLFGRRYNSQQGSTDISPSRVGSLGKAKDRLDLLEGLSERSDNGQNGESQSPSTIGVSHRATNESRSAITLENLPTNVTLPSTISGNYYNTDYTIVSSASARRDSPPEDIHPVSNDSTFLSRREPQADQSSTLSSDLLLNSELQNQDEKHGIFPDSAELDIASDGLIKATSMYEWQDTSLEPQKYAVFLSSEGDFNRTVRQVYFELYNFHNMSLLEAFRKLCGNLYVRGETQEIDRLIESFANRWRACNMQDKYVTKDIAHIITFALTTLNTDLHIANIEADQRMSRSAFVRNTLNAINTGCTERHAETQHRPEASRQSTSTSLAVSGLGREITDEQSIRVVPRSTSSATIHDSPAPSIQEFVETRVSDYQVRLYQNSVQDTASPYSSSNPSRSGSTRKVQDQLSIRASGLPYFSARNAHLKEILQEMYQSVKYHQIKQPDDSAYGLVHPIGSTYLDTKIDAKRDTGTRNHMLQAMEMDLESPLSARFSINRHRPGSAAGNFSYSRSSNTPSLLHSKLNSSLANSDSVHHSIGFASSLSKVMIREEPGSPLRSEFEVTQAIEEAELDSLTLSGPPFAKEGRLYHRQAETAGKRRLKHKGWSSELFAVLGTGSMQLFDFSAKSTKSTQALYGGGDWTRNARGLLDIDLTQAQACSFPVNQTSHGRKHVWQLLLSSGEVHLFAVGTDELVQEWTDTANYWAAKLTKEPLLGAVDNADYGWGACLATLEDSLHADKPGDRAHLQAWQPDPIPLMQSDLPVHDQLDVMQNYVGKLQDELVIHTSKLPLMKRAFSPRHTNQIKALNNHNAKEKYLLAQVSKYSRYVSALRNGIEKAEKVHAERDNKQLRVLQDG